MSILSYLKELFVGRPLITQFEQMLVEEEARKNKEPTPAPLEPEVVTKVAPVAEPVPEPVIEVALEPVAEPVPEPVAEVAPVAKVAPKRAKSNGKFVADDKTTPDVNEAWVGGKAPVKAPAKKTNKRNTKRKKK